MTSNLSILQINSQELQMLLRNYKKGNKMKEIKSFNQFKINIEKYMPDFKPVERVIYLLRHRTLIAKYGGDYQMIADYLNESTRK